jgi:prepilin signal peptidase PulO-like enzyme (type II secretory pathway)
MKIDERSQQVAGQSATVMLGLTQVALGVVLLVRLYVFDQPDAELRDFQWVLLGSIVGYFALRSFLGGIMPVPTMKQAVLAYLGMTLFLFVVLSLWLGLPDLSDWTNNVLPAILGPAIVVGGYWLIAALGKWRVEREILD